MELLKFALICAGIVLISCIKVAAIAGVILILLLILAIILKQLSLIKLSALMTLPYILVYLLFSYGYAYLTGENSLGLHPITTALRSFDIALFSLIFIRKVDFYKLFSFSGRFTFLLVSLQVHSRSLLKLRKELDEAFTSRSFAVESYRDRLNKLGIWLGVMMNRSIRKSEEVKYAFRSRGFDVQT